MQNNPPSGTPPDGQGGPGGTSGANVTHTGATTLTSETTGFNAGEDGFVSTVGGQNALLVTGGEFTISDIKVAKSGDESSEDSDFYGTNAAVLVTGGSLNLSNNQITTNGAHANALFAYGDGSIAAKNVTIKTSSNNSGGIMVTGGGSLTATDLNVETSGNSSAAIRSDRGGGTMTIDGGSYKTTGVGSPAIYSTANITASRANLTSTASEGVVIEGSNSVTLYETTLTDTNNTLNGNSETYKNIFIYQSMSGDAEEGTGSFSATNSTITTNQGDTFFVTNTTANISLENNRIVNNDQNSAFLRAQAGKWGTAGNNGGHVNLTLNGQVAEGDIILDNLSTLSLVLSNQSFYMGAINTGNTASSVSLNIDATSQFILTNDTYLSTLTNADATNQNIYGSGYKLYVGGTAVEVNDGEVPETPEVAIEEKSEDSTTDVVVEPTTGKSSPNLIPLIVGGVALLVIIAGIIAVILHNKKKKGPGSVMGAPETANGPALDADGHPDFSAFDDGPVAQPQIQPQPQSQPPQATNTHQPPIQPSHKPMVGQM